MKRSTIGAGVLALALGLSACGAASPSTPATGSDSGTTGGTTSGGAATSATSATTSGDTGAATSATSATTSGDTTSGGTTSATSTTSDTTSGGTTSATSTTSDTSATGGASATGDTVVDAAIADPRFSTLVSLLEATGLSQQLAQAGPFTIFAPTNEAFAALPAGTLEALAQNPSLLQSILLYHVAPGELTSADVATATSAPTQEGSEIQISTEGNTVTLNGTATVIEPDITVGNGVIHVIDQVLLPPDVSLPAAG